MDDDELRQALDRWVSAGLIDNSTATAIFDHEKTGRERDNSGRLAMVIAAMGALLIGAGILAVLATHWDTLGTAGQTLILVLAPTTAALLSHVLDRRDARRASFALWALAAGLIGPSLFLLAEIHTTDLTTAGIFLGWGLFALPMGHAYRSRLVTMLGLVVILIGVVLSVDGQSGAFAAAALGSLLVLAGVMIKVDYHKLRVSYRLVAVVPLIVLLLWLSTLDGQFATLDLTPITLLVGAIIAGTLSLAGLILGYHRRRIGYPDVVLGGVPLIGTVLALAVVSLQEWFPSVVLLLGIHVLFLASLLTLVTQAISLRSRWLVNLVAIGFLLQVLSLTTTVADELSGALALIVAGVVLLTGAILIERGRRAILFRFGSKAT